MPAHLLLPTPPMSAGSFNFPPSNRYAFKRYDHFALNYGRGTKTPHYTNDNYHIAVKKFDKYQ